MHVSMYVLTWTWESSVCQNTHPWLLCGCLLYQKDLEDFLQPLSGLNKKNEKGLNYHEYIDNKASYFLRGH